MGTVVGQSTHNLNIKGLNPVANIEGEKIAISQIYYRFNLENNFYNFCLILWPKKLGISWGIYGWVGEMEQHVLLIVSYYRGHHWKAIAIYNAT